MDVTSVPPLSVVLLTFDSLPHFNGQYNGETNTSVTECRLCILFSLANFPNIFCMLVAYVSENRLETRY